MKTRSERVQIPVAGASMPAYLSRPDDTGKYPAVILYQEIFGVNGHIRSVADRVAAEGYVVVAPEPFHRSAPGIELGYDAEGLGKGIELMQQVKPQELLADIHAVYDYATDRADVAGKGVGAMGFCFGGHLTYLSAGEVPLAAAASFYGGGIASTPATLDRTKNIQGKVLCFFGENDGYIPPSDIERIRQALAQASVRNEVHVYPNVGHGFFCDERPDYDEKSAADAWRRVVALFEEELS